jgi:hypothetical protein
MAGHSLVLPFDSDDPRFARGFEAGRLWALLCSDPESPVEELVRGSNAEMFLRMAEATGRGVSSEEVDDTWIQIRFAPAALDVAGAPLEE